MPPALMMASLYLRPMRELLSVTAQEMPMTVFSWPVSSSLSDEQEQMSAADMMKDVVRMIVFILQKLNTQTAEKQRKPLFGRLSRRFSGDLLGARTQDPNIKSVVLYQLS